MKSGQLLTWGDRLISVYAKGRWTHTAASLSSERTRLVEVGDRVCLLHADRLYVVAPDGQVSAAKNYLDDPAIAAKQTRGESWKIFTNSKPEAAAWGKDRLLIMAREADRLRPCRRQADRRRADRDPRSRRLVRASSATARGRRGSSSRSGPGIK